MKGNKFLTLIMKLIAVIKYINSNKGYYLETGPDPIAKGNWVELFTHKPSKKNTNWQCMVTHAWLCYRCLLSAQLVDENLDSNYNHILANIWKSENGTRDIARERSDLGGEGVGGGCPTVGSFCIFGLKIVQSGAYLERKFGLKVWNEWR